MCVARFHCRITSFSSFKIILLSTPCCLHHSIAIAVVHSSNMRTYMTLRAVSGYGRSQKNLCSGTIVRNHYAE